MIIFINLNFVLIYPVSIFRFNLINFFYLFTNFLTLVYFLITLNLDWIFDFCNLPLNFLLILFLHSTSLFKTKPILLNLFVFYECFFKVTKEYQVICKIIIENELKLTHALKQEILIFHLLLKFFYFIVQYYFLDQILAINNLQLH